MKFIIKIALIIAILAPSLHAQKIAPYTRKTLIGAGLAAVAANAAAASRTLTLDVTPYDQITLVLTLSRTAGVAITLTITESVDGGSTYGAQHSSSVASGTVTISPVTWTTGTISADYTLSLPIGCKSITHMKIVVAVTTGGAADLITAKVMGGTS